MKKNIPMKKFLFLYIAVLFASVSFSQDNIILLSGDIKENVKVDSISKEYMFYTTAKGKSKSVDIITVFCVSNVPKVYSNEKNAIETIYYKQDSAMAYDLDVEQMRLFIQGEMDAKKKYKSCVATTGGVVVGGLSAYLGFWGIPMPIIYGLGTNLMKPNLKKINPDIASNEYYINGFQSKAKSKRFKNSLIGGLGTFGAVAALIIFM